MDKLFKIRTPAFRDKFHNNTSRRFPIYNSLTSDILSWSVFLICQFSCVFHFSCLMLLFSCSAIFFMGLHTENNFQLDVIHRWYTFIFKRPRRFISDGSAFLPSAPPMVTDTPINSNLACKSVYIVFKAELCNKYLLSFYLLCRAQLALSMS